MLWCSHGLSTWSFHAFLVPLLPLHLPPFILPAWRPSNLHDRHSTTMKPPPKTQQKMIRVKWITLIISLSKTVLVKLCFLGIDWVDSSIRLSQILLWTMYLLFILFFPRWFKRTSREKLLLPLIQLILSLLHKLQQS